MSQSDTANTAATQRPARFSAAAKCTVLAVCGLGIATMGQNIFSGTALGNLFGPSGDDQSQKRNTILDERTSMLEELYAAKPEMREQIQKAAGYATFKKTDIHLLLVASGNGYGVAVNNATGQNTYMRVASLGTGIGMGVKDLRVIFVFSDPAVLDQFINQGWQFGTDADATAQYDNAGAAASQTNAANVNFQDGTVAGGASVTAGAGESNSDNAAATQSTTGGMQIYQFTQSGISLQATVSGTKYWKDSDLNN